MASLVNLLVQIFKVSFFMFQYFLQIGCFSRNSKKKMKTDIPSAHLPKIVELQEFINDDVSEYQEYSKSFNHNTIEEINTAEELPDLTKIYFTYDYKNGTGELYMRVGTAIFSVCALISSSLKLVQMIEIYFNNYPAVVKCKLTFNITVII